jgi:hypothetical protein
MQFNGVARRKIGSGSFNKLWNVYLNIDIFRAPPPFFWFLQTKARTPRTTYPMAAVEKYINKTRPPYIVAIQI